MIKHIQALAFFFAFLIPSLFFPSCGVKDSTIQESVETALRGNTDLSGITASVKGGVVTLTGEVKDEMSKSSLESMVGKINGVKQIVNNTTVAAPAPAAAPVVINPDDELMKAAADAIKDYPGVKTAVKDGVITLTGNIKRADLQKLMMALNTLKPKKIENHLTVK
jgi:osmotically-inducible protein OsmY